MTCAGSSPFEHATKHSGLNISCRHLVLGNPNPTCMCLFPPHGLQGGYNMFMDPTLVSSGTLGQSSVASGGSWLPFFEAWSCSLAGKCPPSFLPRVSSGWNGTSKARTRLRCACNLPPFICSFNFLCIVGSAHPSWISP